MADYIDRTKIYEKPYFVNNDILREIFRRVVDDIPAADVVERKRGKWGSDCVCSECGFHRQTTRSNNYMIGKFCPNCGADMRGEG